MRIMDPRAGEGTLTARGMDGMDRAGREMGREGRWVGRCMGGQGDGMGMGKEMEGWETGRAGRCMGRELFVCVG